MNTIPFDLLPKNKLITLSTFFAKAFKNHLEQKSLEETAREFECPYSMFLSYAAFACSYLMYIDNHHLHERMEILNSQSQNPKNSAHIDSNLKENVIG